MENVTILRRPQSEIKVFGGDVYIDIDGKNIGTVSTQDLRLTLSSGKHTIKMYKSHTMGTFIGVAETEIDIVENEKLYVRYSPPLMANQPGNLIVAPYDSDSQLDRIISDIDKKIDTDFTEQQIKIEKTRQESEKTTQI